jgi:hypothetical protein
LRTAEAPGVIEGCFSGPNFALRRRLDGGYTIAVPGYGRVEIAPQNLRHSVKFGTNLPQQAEEKTEDSCLCQLFPRTGGTRDLARR